MNRRPGCLGGILRLAFIAVILDWLQDKFRFSRGFSCAGIGCGMIVLVLLVVFSCSTCLGTDWFRLGF
jgi:hypothetical protein